MNIKFSVSNTLIKGFWGTCNLIDEGSIKGQLRIQKLVSVPAIKEIELFQSKYDLEVKSRKYATKQFLQI